MLTVAIVHLTDDAIPGASGSPCICCGPRLFCCRSWLRSCCLRRPRAILFQTVIARQRAARLTLQAFAALLAGFFFYPMSATFVLVPAAHLLLTENRRQVRRMAVLAVAIVGSAFVAVFLIHKFIVLPHLTHLPDVGDYQFKFTDNAAAEAVRRLWIYLADRLVALARPANPAVSLPRWARCSVWRGILRNTHFSSHDHDTRIHQCADGLLPVCCGGGAGAGCSPVLHYLSDHADHDRD